MALTLNTILRFKGCQVGDLEEINKHCKVLRVSKGELVFREGREPNGLYVIVSGYVKITKEFSTGHECLLHIFGPGDSVGEMALFSGRKFPATATALSDLELLFVPSEIYHALVKRSHSFTTEAALAMAGKSDLLCQKVVDTIADDVEARLKRFLHELDIDFGRPYRGATRSIPFYLSRAEFASAVNARSETVSRVMSEWDKLGALVVSKKQMIVDPGAFPTAK